MPEERKKIPVWCYNASNYDKGQWLQDLENDALTDVLQPTLYAPDWLVPVKSKVKVRRSGKGRQRKPKDIDNAIGYIYHRKLKPYLLVQENKNLFSPYSIKEIVRRFQTRDLRKFRKAERFHFVEKGKYQRVLTIATPVELLEPYEQSIMRLCDRYNFELFTYPDPILSKYTEAEWDLALEHAEIKLKIVQEIYEKHYSKYPVTE